MFDEIYGVFIVIATVIASIAISIAFAATVTFAISFWPVLRLLFSLLRP